MFMIKLWIYALTFALSVTSQLHPKEPARYVQLPSLRDQAKIIDGWTAERISRIPALLEKYKVDAWLMSQREHAEDPIWWSVKNATDFDVHRRTVLLLHTDGASPNPLKWVDNTGQVWKELLHVLQGLDPQRIAINIDRNIAFGGGLHVGEFADLKDNLGEKWMNRTVNIPMLGIEYVATKVDGQLKYYRDLQELTWAMIEEGFSNRVIEPGVTTTQDLEWWFRDKIQEQNLSTWNHPRVSVITPESFPGWEGTEDIIQQGDLLHIDWGITAMNMNTDTQHLAYVLRSPYETDAPLGLKEGLRKANRMQDITLEELKPGLTGNQVLSRCLDRMRRENIDGQIYSHPIGDWGHDAGAVVGFTNLPTSVPVLGELGVLPNTYYSIELYAYHFVPERNETLRFRLEEDAYWDSTRGQWRFVRGRQERFHLVGGEISNAEFQVQG